MKKIILNVNGLLHGADYNPEQWLSSPGVLTQDIALMKKAHCNVMSIGMFSWSMLEPEEGVYTLDWLEDIINRLYKNGIHTMLATPSGARPPWLAQKYPEVLRVTADRVRNLYGHRHNHCYTSPIYREKISKMNEKLSERFANHPGIIVWHISNEYGGECHCPLCQSAFREWLKEKYETLEALNEAWYTTFWSHRYTAWSQIESPAPHGEKLVHGQNLDWRRFVTAQTLDFYKHEVKSARKHTPHLPVTMNMMYYFNDINYFAFKDEVDIISWDSYPVWHKWGKKELDIAVDTAMYHDIMRSIKKQPFLLMESSPSMTNWQSISKLKKPQMHMLSSLQAVAHGSDSVQYFQWRKSRGASEKLHGAVVDHYGKEDTRVFREVAELGERLKTLGRVQGSNVEAEVAILYDWENKWAVEDSQGPRNTGMHYKEAVQDHYRAFWEMGISVDFVDMTADISTYKVFVAPMMYLTRSGIEEKIRAFVAAGGCFITTYWSGIVGETDLCHLGGTPHGLMDIVGLRSEEIDGLFDGETNRVKCVNDRDTFAKDTYSCSELCDLVLCDTAEPLLVYEEDFYEERPAVTQNHFGKGIAYYLCSRFESAFYQDFYEKLGREQCLNRPFKGRLPKGVTASMRKKEDTSFVFVQNFNHKAVMFEEIGRELQPFEVYILER